MPLSERESEAYSHSLPSLVHQLVIQLSTLMRQELSLARSEIHHSLLRWKSSACTMVSGLALIFAGFLFCLAALVVGLAHVVPLWVAALGVGLIVFAGGVIVMQSGQRQLKASSLTPSHLPESLRQDRDVLLRKHPL